jgi:peroxiredoxin Q/BCP
MTRLSFASLTLATLLAALPGFADDKPVPAVGASAPAFRLQDQTGAWRSLSDYTGKWLVLYFYPKDDTPGCTTQVCSFRDEITRVRQAGAEVVGVSLDDVRSHEAFAAKHRVPFPLLADVDAATAQAYGVLTSRAGVRYARRDTFVIDPAGRIAKHYESVDPKENVAQVITDLAALKANPL